MKWWNILLGALGLSALLWLIWPVTELLPGEAPAQEPVLLTAPGEVVVVETDAAAVFRRAFWRHPSEADLIQHAERREWSVQQSEGLLRWQWFLQLSPGPELLDVLRKEGAFGLSLSAAPRAWSSLATPPHWFPSRDAIEGHEVYQAPQGGMTLLYLAKENLLFATDEGHGMAAPVMTE
jgi:hypothetical protein